MTEEKTVAAPSPISLEVWVAKLPQNGMPIRFEASEADCAALAEHMGVVAVESMAADLVVKRWKRDGVAVDGRLTAAVVQACVVTLDPVHEAIDEPVEFVFVPETSKLARIAPTSDGELHLDPEGADIPETFRGEKIDLGTFLTELLALSLDPYPRSDGAEFTELDTDPDPTGGVVSPFAGLKRLQDGDKG